MGDVSAAVSRGLLLLVTVLCAVNHVGAMEVYVPEELFVENGTHVTLPCTFKSTEVVSALTSLTWSFTAEGSRSTKAIIFYYGGGKAYPTLGGPFRSRVTWAGDMNKGDASIMIKKIRFKDNGTYTCQVLNPPDIVGHTSKNIKLQVVEKVNHVDAMEVYVPEELLVESGSPATLPCTFRSTEVVSALTSVTWSFTTEGSGCSETIIFYYAGGKSYPALGGPFRSRVTWAGDMNKRDASIMIEKISIKDNGTYTCQVLNPPDIVGHTSKNIKLQVVEEA